MATLLARPSFSQSTIVIATIGAAWLLWLAANNKLLLYWQILMGAGAATAGGSSGTTTNPNPGGQQLFNVPNTFQNYVPYPFNQPARQ